VAQNDRKCLKSYFDKIVFDLPISLKAPEASGEDRPNLLPNLAAGQLLY